MRDGEKGEIIKGRPKDKNDILDINIGPKTKAVFTYNMIKQKI